MVSADHMAISLRVCSHPLEDSIPTTVAVTLAMTGQRIPASHPTGSSDRSTASHEAYEHQYDNWTANHLPHGTADSHASTIATHAT